MSFSARSTRITRNDLSWDIVSRLTGIDAESGVDGLAEALECGRESVRAVLTNRGDTIVRDALPEFSHSAGLADTLTNLEKQLSLGRNQGKRRWGH